MEPADIIKGLVSNGGRVRQTARELGISPGTVVYWRKRATTPDGRLRFKGLKRRSTRPKTKRVTSLSAEHQDATVVLRRESNRGARKIRYLLQLPCNDRTVHRFLRTKGLIKERRKYKRPYFQPTTHMHVKNVTAPGKLQMDVKYVTPELSGLAHTCYLYAVMDIFSRWKQGIIFPLLDQSYAIGALKGIAEVLPFSADFIQTDNGLEFQQRFHEFVTKKLSYQHHYIHKSSPNENAVIERSFRTDEEEFFFFALRKIGRPKNIFQLNQYYQEYINSYNQERPHLSLEMMTPMEKLKSVQ